METNKIWGFVLIGLSVIFGLWGVASLWAAFSYGDVAAALSQAGGMYGTQMQATMDAMKPSKLPGFFLLILSGVCGFFGNKLLKSVKEN